MNQNVENENIDIATLQAKIEKLKNECQTLREEVKAAEDDGPDVKKLKSSIKERDTRLNALYEYSRDYVYTIAADGTMVSLNPAFEAITGWKPYEWIGKNFIGLVHPDDQEQAKKNFEIALTEDIPPANELRIMKNTGESVYIEFKGRPIKDGDEVVSVFGVGRDITDRKKEEEALRLAKEQAEAATKLKDTFISLVSHDLRSPISSIALLFSELRRSEKNFDGLEEVFQVMIESAETTCETLIDTIDQLLDISRLQTGRIELRPFNFNIRSLVSETFVGIDSLAQDKGVELKNEAPEELKLTADRNLVAQVVGNLVSNALKFSKKGDKITVFVSNERPISIGVKDSGVGIDQKDIPNLFKHEIKTSTVGTGGERGAGLGLPLSNDIMALHGGDISVESAVGEGSVFYLNFPAEGEADVST